VKKFKMYLFTAIGGTILAGTALVLTTSRVQAGFTKPTETSGSCSYRAAGQCGNGGTLMVLEDGGFNCRPSFCYYGAAR
jgi:hypothetical protein